MNNRMTLQPYWREHSFVVQGVGLIRGGGWVFDDPEHDLQYEAFVAGADDILERALQKKGIGLVRAKQGFNLQFSATPFEGAEVMYHRGPAKFVDEKTGQLDKCGDYYGYEDIVGWLCPALLCYFPDPPERIYFTVEEL